MVKVIRPTPLVREAAGVLEPVLDEVVVIGAVAILVALNQPSDGPAKGATRDVDVIAISPTRDVDLAVSGSTAAAEPTAEAAQRTVRRGAASFLRDLRAAQTKP